MNLADLFQQTEQLWAENVHARHELSQSILELERSLSQRPDYETSAEEIDEWARRRSHSCRDDPPEDFHCDA